MNWSDGKSSTPAGSGSAPGTSGPYNCSRVYDAAAGETGFRDPDGYVNRHAR
jgi:hypothetical protein